MIGSCKTVSRSRRELNVGRLMAYNTYQICVIMCILIGYMVSLKTFTRTIVFAVLLMNLGGQPAHAETKVYQYDGKLPFVQMMLNMMVAMGVLDRLPANGAYGLSGYPSSPWSRYTNPLNNSGSLWGNPSWGVLPADSYARNNYSPYVSPWSADDLTGWVNESWETSQWNAKAESKPQVSDLPKNQPQATAPPIVQNFNYNTPQAPGYGVDQKKQRSPLARHARPNQAAKKPASQANKQARLNKNLKQMPPQKPCITDFCGLKKPSLNGLWLTQDGEMLGVNNNRYLWTDNKSRYLTGQIKVQNEYLLTNVDGYDQLMRFKYKLAGNRLLTLQPGGKIREFARVSASQYNNAYRGYGQNYGNYYQ